MSKTIVSNKRLIKLTNLIKSKYPLLKTIQSQLTGNTSQRSIHKLVEILKDSGNKESKLNINDFSFNLIFSFIKTNSNVVN